MVVVFVAELALFVIGMLRDRLHGTGKSTNPDECEAGLLGNDQLNVGVSLERASRNYTKEKCQFADCFHSFAPASSSERPGVVLNS